MHMISGRAPYASNKQSEGFYGIGKLADTTVGPDGLPINVDSGDQLSLAQLAQVLGTSPTGTTYNADSSAVQSAGTTAGVNQAIQSIQTPTSATPTGTSIPCGQGINPIPCTPTSGFFLGWEDPTLWITIGGAVLLLVMFTGGGRR